MGLSLKSTSSKVLASAALLAAAAGVAGMGTYGGFTASTSASATVNAGTVKFDVGTAGAANRLTVAATGAIPGDTVQRAVTLTNTGDQSLTAVTLTTAAAPSSKLDTDAVNGLQMQVDACPTAWTEAGASPSFTYTCSGAITPVLVSRAVVGTKMALTGLTSVAPTKTDFLRVTLTVPTSADNTFQGLTSTIGFVFDAVQRAGGASK
ncbi:TasA family protein [Arthrobacter oryzae]|uniref:Camelysin-like metallo-endopeptidase n=1 Tax=Arthrobacter oryzae TaxID=409290 RepID=A0A495E7B1_9MICC|nr:TasA family protein [Arthrobacter oryzae]RKR12686.1 camelysin-like metallo-endopeptidase [Arthrobacter oryzae]